MTWGTKLILTFIAFAIFMGIMVYKCTQYNVDLVSKEYYADELRYQEKIDGMNNAARLTQPMLAQNPSNLILTMPAELKDVRLKGNLLFYCPTNSVNDRNIALETNDEGKQFISKNLFPVNNYVVKIQWEAAGVSYYCEQPLTLHE